MSHYAPAAGKLFLPADGQGQAHHVGSPRLTQHPGRLRQCGPGGTDVVDQQEALPGDVLRTDSLVYAQDIGPAGVGIVQAGLGRVVRCLAQGLLGLVVSVIGAIWWCILLFG